MANAGTDRMPEAGGATTPPPPAAPRKRQLRNYLLDKKLQLRYVALVIFVSAVVSGTLGYLVWYQAHYASQTIIASMERPDMAWLGPEMKGQVVQRLQTSDTSLVLTMAGVGVGLMVILTLYLILMTHKVAGPLYKIGHYFDDIRDGRLPKHVELRKGDQLQDFFLKFKEMNESVRARAAEDASAFGRFVDACEKAGVPTAGELGHCLDELRAAKKQKETSLG